MFANMPACAAPAALSWGLLRLRLPGCCIHLGELRYTWLHSCQGHACLQTCQPALHPQPFGGTWCSLGTLSSALLTLCARAPLTMMQMTHLRYCLGQRGKRE